LDFGLSLDGETLAAINGAIIPRLKRNLTSFSAGSAYRVEHLTRSSASVFASVTAGFASLGFVGEALFLIKILLAGREYKLLPAILAYECFVLMNQLKYLFRFYLVPRGM
jgi:hypothetical protein